MFEIIERDNLIPRATELGIAVQSRLNDLAAKTSKIKDIRGKGLFIGIEIDSPAGEIVKQCLSEGVLIGSAQANVLRLAPPMTVTEDELDKGLTLLEKILGG